MYKRQLQGRYARAGLFHCMQLRSSGFRFQDAVRHGHAVFMAQGQVRPQAACFPPLGAPAGKEMCIRDRYRPCPGHGRRRTPGAGPTAFRPRQRQSCPGPRSASAEAAGSGLSLIHISEDTYNALQKYGQDLVDLARKQKLDPVIGRDQEIRNVIRILRCV